MDLYEQIVDRFNIGFITNFNKTDQNIQLFDACSCGSEYLLKRALLNQPDEWNISFAHAIRYNKKQMINYIVENHGDHLYDYNYAMYFAAENNNQQQLSEMLKMGAYDVNTALIFAAKNGHTSMVDHLIRNLGATNHFNALLYAIANGRSNVVQYFMRNYSYCKKQYDWMLNYAIMNGQNRWYHDNETKGNNSYSNYFVHACKGNNLYIVNSLINKKFSVNVVNKAAIGAAFNGHFELVKKLLSMGANDYNAIMVASIQDMSTEINEIIILMIRKGANDWDTAFAFAAYRNSVKNMEFFIFKGCTKNGLKKGCEMAAFNGNLQVLKWIMDRKEMRKARSNHIYYAILFYAVRNNHQNIVNYVLDYIDRTNIDMLVIAHYVALKRIFYMINYLIKHKLCTLVDFMDYAVKHDDLFMIRFITKKGFNDWNEGLRMSAKYGNNRCVKYFVGLGADDYEGAMISAYCFCNHLCAQYIEEKRIKKEMIDRFTTNIGYSIKNVINDIFEIFHLEFEEHFMVDTPDYLHDFNKEIVELYELVTENGGLNTELLMKTFLKLNYCFKKRNVRFQKILDNMKQLIKEWTLLKMECSICLQNILYNEEHFETKCKHVYHLKCIARWLRENSSCPMCRARI